MTPKSIDRILEEFDSTAIYSLPRRQFVMVTGSTADGWVYNAREENIEDWLRSAIASAILHAAEECKPGATPFEDSYLLNEYRDALRAYAEKMTKVV